MASRALCRASPAGELFRGSELVKISNDVASASPGVSGKASCAKSKEFTEVNDAGFHVGQRRRGRSTEGAAGGRFLHMLSVLRRQRIHRLAGDHVPFGEPLSQIDHLAALAAERPPPVLAVKAACLAALRTTADTAGRATHRAQHCMSKGMSVITCWLRALMSRALMKRMLKRWRLALISG